ncbi:MAG: 1-deoxy-D-xylulose-5-phosphate reductoisomerase [Chloroflexi bacterium]|nr:1-deoxy-D-xylulose-5-phosphate reductoisomerase [Chloroflexota bacterium]
MKTLAVLGSTGSIGRQTLDVVRAFPQKFKVAALAGGSNVELLASQVREFQPGAVFTPALESQPDVRRQLFGARVEFLAMEDITALPEVDMVIVATSGKAGLAPTLSSLRQGKAVALANKEVLVAAGALVNAEAARHQAKILPIDSEHSALWQCLRGEDSTVSKLILTASGGPFRNHSKAELATVTARDALKHPTWTMGPKVTVDSATLMNKGLEVIEAHWLFGIPLESIQVVVHPESIIHSMVEFIDGSLKAQLSYPDMRLPIQYALSYPERLPGQFVNGIDFARTQRLTFDEPDWELFPCPRLAIEAARKGGTYPAALCAADEVAVDLFLRDAIGFLDIQRIIESVLQQHESKADPTLSDIENADAMARRRATEIAEAIA